MLDFKAPLALIVLGALAACHKESSEPPQTEPAARPRAPVRAAQHLAGPEEMTAGMIEAVGLGKSQLPVVVKFDLAKRPAIGEPLDILVALVASISAGPAAIDVAAADGFKVEEGSAHIEIPAVEATQVYRETVKITPSAEGVLLVALKVSLTHDQMSDSRVFSIPIIVASQPQTAQVPAR